MEDKNGRVYYCEVLLQNMLKCEIHNFIAVFSMTCKYILIMS